MSSSNTIIASNLGSVSSDEVKQFFSFCGKISNISIKEAEGGTQTATVVFEKPSAAKTALLLDKTQLSGSEIHVSAQEGSSSGSTETTQHHESHDGEIEQEDKPKSRILAEYLASGYKLGDAVLTRAIQADKNSGFSSRFQAALQNFDQKTGASSKAIAVDNKYQLSDTATKSAQQAWLGLSSYYEKFTGTPAGSKVHHFYTTSEKQIADIHNEALRLANLKKDHTGVYPAQVVSEENGTKKTHCGCQGEDGVCGCKQGQCTCSGCSKSDSTATEKPSTTGQTATGAADKIASTTAVDPLANQKQ